MMAGELRWLILDEADRLLDLGFEAKLKAIIDVLDQKAQQVRGVCEVSSQIWAEQGCNEWAENEMFQSK